MNFDVRTLYVQTTLIYIFLSLALLLYLKHHKTYPGFTHWMVGTFLVSFGYLAVVLRGIVPDWISILANNGLFVGGAVVRLDGTIRFTRGTTANKLIYTLPAVIVLIASYFYFVDDQIAMRVLALSVIISSVSIAIAYEMFCYAPRENSRIYTVWASLVLLFALGMIVRALTWTFVPTLGIFEPTPMQTSVALGLGIMELGWMFCLLMLNSQRLEAELKHSEAQLAEKVTSLKKALSEVKTLTGLLPMCASCKRIRDDKGYWNQLERYIMMHSDARFTHGVCPDCARQLYPEHFDDANDGRQQKCTA